MNHIKGFSEIHKEDANIAGGKGASLGEMTNAGIPVPPGFVLLSSAFDAFLDETNIKAGIEGVLAKTHHDIMHEVENASEEIQEIIISQELPENLTRDILSSFKTLGATYVAVRSSATAEDGAEHAWAGQLDTYLNTTEDELLKNVKRCWASLFTPRAIFYRFEKGLAATHISVAVVIQKMVESEFSGIAFSVHPVTEDRNQMIIEAGFGLGEAIVSGQVTPDSYVVTKSPRDIVDINVSEQSRALYRAEAGGNEWRELGKKGESQVLTKEQIIELGEIIVRIENHYGFPCDIEWAYEKGAFYITQSRPITTLSNKNIQPKQNFTKTFTRDFSLVAVEAWYRGETSVKKEWTENMQPHLPYIFFKREDGTTTCYYDLAGVNWVKEELLKKAKEDEGFVRRVAATVHEKLRFIRPAYEKGIPLEHQDLVTFLEDLEAYYPWFEAFWWLMEMSEEELGGLDVTPARKVREETNDLSVQVDKLIRVSLKKLYPGLGDCVDVLRTEEIRSNTFPSKEELQNRMSGFFFTGNELFINTNRHTVEERFNITIDTPEIPTNLKEINGTVAYPGKVKGSIVRVMSSKDFGKVKEGSIIVSPMTMPDFLPGMQKAAGFITDEGGMTCHAAIVARELKKTCIVGTKIATEVLNDGDLVEVDADNGVVRILKKINTIDANDYDLNFKSEGVPILFLDIGKNYNPVDAIEVSLGKSYQSVYSKKCFDEMNVLGKSEVFLSEMERRVAIFNKSIKCLKEFAVTESLGREDLVFLFEHMDKIAYAFGIFNNAYLDAFFSAQENPNAEGKAAIEKVGNYKNLLREDTNETFFNPGGLLERILKVLSRKYSVSVGDLWCYQMNELIDLFNDKKISVEEVGRRKDAFIYIRSARGVEFFSGDEAKAKAKPFIREDVPHGAIVGKMANGGKVVAKVRVIITNYLDIEGMRQQMNEMQEGEILVSQLTAPELMPAIIKSSGIITDLGGMLSHAAITSRELNKPCIVGTGNATKMLQTGELVELDADKGTVRIIKNAIEESKKHLDKNHLSLSEWFSDAGVGDEDAFRNEDNDKRERLKVLQEIINIPFDKPTQFLASDIAEKTPELVKFLAEHGNEPCALRLIPTVDGLPKLRMRGQTVKEVTGKWFDEQKIDASKYRADYMPHSHESLWSTIFIVNKHGIFGEMVQGGHDQLTSGHYEEKLERYQFSFDFKKWEIFPENKEALEHIKEVVEYVRVEDEEKRKQIIEKLDGVFYENYLGGYLESVLSKEFGLWFVDYNRILGNMYESMTLPHYGDAGSASAKGTVVYGKGIVEGVVVMIDSEAETLPDISHIENPILVIKYTMPQHVGLMKQAVAIITDEGGLLSHASIISRELKKVCIIGTKNATQILKDGDLVEVDADTGVVHILKNE